MSAVSMHNIVYLHSCITDVGVLSSHLLSAVHVISILYVCIIMYVIIKICILKLHDVSHGLHRLCCHDYT